MPSYESTSSNSRAGSTGYTTQSPVGLNPAGAPASKTYGWTNANEQALYSKWANLYNDYDLEHSNLNSYLDYFFSGQDIQVYIEGLTDPADVLPIYQFGYNIQQNKQALYGFWSYTHDAVMRGTRIVNGAFSVATVTPGFVTEKVAKAAKIRAERLADNKPLFPIRGLNDDEANIEKYWKKNLDPSLTAGQNHLFSVHPPFNMIIVYGVQDVSITDQTGAFRANQTRFKYANSTALMSDTNERIVEPDQDKYQMRILIENVELLSRQTEYTPEGDPVMETYSFMARDIREAPIANTKTVVTSNSSVRIYRS